VPDNLYVGAVSAVVLPDGVSPGVTSSGIATPASTGILPAVPPAKIPLASQGVNQRLNDVDNNCVIPIDSHKDGKTKRTQTSTIITYGTNISIKICQLEHYKQTQYVTEYITPKLPLPLQEISAITTKCGSPYCPKKEEDVPCPFVVYSLKSLSKPIFHFCSFNCCIDKMSRCSDSHLSRVLKSNTNEH